MKLLNPDNLRHLNPDREIYEVIGSICKNPRLLRDPDIHLDENDFLKQLHKIIFAAINNIVYSMELTEDAVITEANIDNELEKNSVLYKAWNEQNGIEYVRKCISTANPSTFKMYYDSLKKYSLLREFVQEGIDVSDIFDFESVDLKTHNDGKERIKKMALEEIVEHFALKMSKLRNKWNISKNSKNFMAGDNLENLLSKLKEEPEFGYPFQNPFYNAIFRGMRDGKFMLRSASTGGGKTRQSLADMCSISCDEIYDYERGWIRSGVTYPTLFISTELEKEELQTVMLAFITGVQEDIIKEGNYSADIQERLEYGVQVIKRAKIHAVYVDDFSIGDIEGIIEQHILEQDVRYVAFDYIQLTAKLSRTMNEKFGTTLREDQILVQFSAAMKLLANKYQVFIESSTQLNRNHKESENRDTSSLRGGSATADKVDHGIQSYSVTGKDKENLKALLDNGFPEPNFSHWVYKNRSGQNKIVIWTQMDMGTMRETICFLTDYDYNHITFIKPKYVDLSDEAEFELEEDEQYHVDF